MTEIYVRRVSGFVGKARVWSSTAQDIEDALEEYYDLIPTAQTDRGKLDNLRMGDT